MPLFSPLSDAEAEAQEGLINLPEARVSANGGAGT